MENITENIEIIDLKREGSKPVIKSNPELEALKNWKKTKKLSKKLAAASFVFGLMITLITGTIIGFDYYNIRIKNYTDKLYCLVDSAVDYIDPAKLEEYIETQQKDEYYDVVLGHLNNIKDYCDLEYYYVCVPYEDHFIYVWDTDYGQGPVNIGDVDYYAEGDDEIMLSIMYGGNTDYKMYMDKYGEYGYIGSVYTPIKNSNGENIALVVADLEVTHIISAIIKSLCKLIGTLCIISVLISIVMYKILSKNIADPIQKVSKAARNMLGHINSDNTLAIDVHTNDEIDEMARSFEKMDAGIKQYVRDLAEITAEKERIGAELNVAERIQSDMLPKDFINTDEVDVFASITPAKEVGADYYDLFMIDEDHLAVVMADVSGKGVPAALFMAISKTLIQDRSFIEKDLGSVFSNVNNILCTGNSDCMYVTAFEGILDLKTGRFTFVNAGHEPPFIMKKDGSFEMYKVDSSLVLATIEDIQYISGSIDLEPGDRLYQYTDGVVRAVNKYDDLFGFSRLEESLNRHKEETVKELLLSVKSDVDAFIGEVSQLDDITMLCLDFKAKKN